MFKKYFNQENKNKSNTLPKVQVQVETGVMKLFSNNKKWASQKAQNDLDFFRRLENGQSPEYLCIGCSDSRVPLEVLLGLNPGEVFVHRNVGNIIMHSDSNAMSVIEYAVNFLKVKHIIVCGHYGCGAVNASLNLPQKTPAIVNGWIEDIRRVRDAHAEELMKLPEDERAPRLCECNVIRQTYNVVTCPVVQNAWANGQDLTVHGFIYQLKDGLLKQLVGPMSSNDEIDGDDENKDNPNNDLLLSKVQKHMKFDS